MKHANRNIHRLAISVFEEVTLSRIWIVFLTAFISFFFYCYPTLTIAQNKKCGSTPDEIGGVYKFEKIVLLITYADKWSPKHPDFPSVLQYENLSKLLMQSIENNFQRFLKDSEGNKKPIILLKSAKRGEGWEELHDKRYLAVMVKVSYMPGSIWTPGVDAYGHITYYIYRKDWSNPAAFIPNPNNSGFLTIFPKVRGFEKAVEQFLQQIRPISAAASSWVVDRCEFAQ